MTLPPTGSPPWLARNVVERAACPPRSRSCRTTNSLFLMIGPPTQTPVFSDVERAGIEGQPVAPRCRRSLVADSGVDRPGQLVGAAAGHGVDAGADEVALTHVDRARRSPAPARSPRARSARRRCGRRAGRAETERVVEVRAVDRDVVHRGCPGRRTTLPLACGVRRVSR